MPENLVPKVKRLLGRLSFNTNNLSQVLDEARAPDWKPLGLSTDDVHNLSLGNIFKTLEPSGLSKKSMMELEEFADKMATTRPRLEKVLIL